MAVTGIVSIADAGDGFEVAPVADDLYTPLYCVFCLTLDGSGGIIVGVLGPLPGPATGDAIKSKMRPDLAQ